MPPPSPQTPVRSSGRPRPPSRAYSCFSACQPHAPPSIPPIVSSLASKPTRDTPRSDPSSPVPAHKRPAAVPEEPRRSSEPSEPSSRTPSWTRSAPPGMAHLDDGVDAKGHPGYPRSVKDSRSSAYLPSPHSQMAQRNIMTPGSPSVSFRRQLCHILSRESAARQSLRGAARRVLRNQLHGRISARRSLPCPAFRDALPECTRVCIARITFP